jgi:tRNA G18 (ribose-2'-O)-methylase SpoU
LFDVRTITSFDLPELQPYRTMRRQMEHRQLGIFVAEGEKVVRRLLESQFGVVSVLLPEKWLADLTGLLERRREKVQVFVANKKLLETLTGFSMYQGLLAIGRVPPALSLEKVVERSPSPRLFAAVENLSSAENMGAVVRNCAGLNVQTLIVGETCSSPYLRRAVRSSMGAIFNLPILETRNLVSTLGQLRARGIRCISAHPHQSRRVSQADFTSDCCLLFGSEGYGISRAALDACDQAAAIPMPAMIDSLNVASAVAVFLYEANRQRDRM